MVYSLCRHPLLLSGVSLAGLWPRANVSARSAAARRLQSRRSADSFQCVFSLPWARQGETQGEVSTSILKKGPGPTWEVISPFCRAKPHESELIKRIATVDKTKRACRQLPPP